MGKKLLYIIIVIIIIGGGVFFFSKNQSKSAVMPTFQNIQITSPSSSGITKAVMSRSIDAKGNATGETTVFNAKTDKIVYAVLSLQNVTKNTKLSYVRYLNGKYVDSKVALPTKDGITTFYFSFEKGIGDYPKGTYTLNVYVDGKRAQSLTYSFK